MNVLTKFVLVALLVSALSIYAKGIDDKFLADIAVQINKQLPVIFDKENRLDSVTPGPGLRLTYNYIMPTPSDKKLFYRQKLSQLKIEVCPIPDMKLYLLGGVIICYSYRASDGSLIANIDMTPKDCGYAD